MIFRAKHIFLLLIMFGASVCVSQASDNQLNYGFDKVQNTYLFRLSSDFLFKEKFGQFKIKQNYSGTSLSSIENYFRDDQSLTFEYNYPVINNISIDFKSNYLLNSDSKSSGINKLQRLNGIIGSEAGFFDVVNVYFGYGVEDHKQGDIKSTGQIINMNYSINDLDYEGFMFHSRGIYEQLDLNHNRSNNDFNISSDLSKIYDNLNNIRLSINYKKAGRDYIQPQATDINNIIVESRKEDRINGNLEMNFNLNDYINSELSFNFENSNIDRFFNKSQESNNYSLVERTLETMIYGFTGLLKFEYGALTQHLGLTMQFRDESNFLDNKFEMLPDDYNRFLTQEKQRDNQNSLSRLFGKSIYNLTAIDTIGINGFVAINRYDTPSKNNFDDRDEFQGNIGIYYSRVFSHFIKVKLLADLTATHLVFLKAQRSSLNNWNRILRLSPMIEYSSKYFSMKPTFELLANYTAYDYETEASGSRSYSFRQVSYSDSLKLQFDEKYSCESRIFAKYNERSILFWNSFSETPQQANYEIFSNLIFFVSAWNSSKIGIGARYYKLRQYNLPYSAMPFSLNQFQQESLGPELNIFIQLSRSSNVIIKGWYEFRNLNNRKIDNTANLILQTNIIL